MTITSILVQLIPYRKQETLCRLAAALAVKHDARLTALCAVPVVQLPGFVQAYVTKDMMDLQRRQAEEAAEAAKAAFLAAAEGEGVTPEWRQVEGDPRRIGLTHTHYADLVMVGQSEPDRPSGNGYDLAEELVLASGRPVMAVPYAGKFESAGERVLIAWNGTREATRALHDALPILERAKQVIVYSVNPPDSDHIPGADIAQHLAQHGVNAEAQHTVAPDLEVGDALLSALSDLGADLLVMGAYGHSRFREFALGGATRHLLRHMTAPVLMSH